MYCHSGTLCEASCNIGLFLVTYVIFTILGALFTPLVGFLTKITQYIMLHSIYYSVSRVVNIAVLASLPIVSAILLEYW